MNGLSELHYAQSIANERARLVEHRAGEAVVLAGLAVDHPVRARLANSLIRLGIWLAPRSPEPARRIHASPSC